MNNSCTRTRNRINLLANDNTILWRLILLNQLTKNRMNSSNQFSLSNPRMNFRKHIKNPSSRGENPLTAITNDGLEFGNGMVICDHPKRGDDVGYSDKGIFDESFLEDPRVADFNCYGGDPEFHGSATE